MYFISESCLFISLVIFFIFGITFTYSPSLGFPKLSKPLHFLFFLILSNYIYLNLNSSLGDISLFNGLFLKDFSSNIYCSILTLFILASIISTYSSNIKLNIPIFELLFLLLISILNLSFFFYSNNLFIFFLLLEVQSIILFIFTAVNKQNRYAIEAALKYFILGSFSSITMLLGISLIYLISSFMSFEDLFLFSNIFYGSNDMLLHYGFSLGLGFFAVGFFFKIYAAPMHFWVSDIYQGATYSMVFFFTISSALSFFLIFIKVFFCVFANFSSLFFNYFLVISLLSIFFGSLGGLIQKKIRKIMAYSSISIVGYIILTLCSGLYISIEYSLLFIFSYLIGISILLIICSFLFLDNNKSIDNYFQLKNTFSSNYILGITMSMALFSLGGIPPFIGFVGKLELLNSFILGSNYFFFFFLFVFSIISFFFYLRLVKYTNTKYLSKWYYFESPSYLSLVILFYFTFLLSISSIAHSTVFLICKIISYSILIF